ncbi:MAG: NAD-dependent epimerase/dehydratase family protein [Fimbriimonadaceae bacterium]|nr:NAD-dependent epimerase/dehydratase family protein [Fimbriimonadaceae bacterium]
MILGGSGFLGKHLQHYSPGEHLAPRSGELNLLDLSACEAYFSQHRPASVIHAAGFVGGIGLNKENPGRMAVENLRMGLNVLEAAARVGLPHVLVVSTVCVYPKDASIPTSEASMWEGAPAEDTMPYGAAKRMLHTVADALHRQYGLGYTYVIPTNLYGPGDHFEEAKSHVVPALLKRADESRRAGLKELVVWGDGTQTRDLLYVEDAAKGLLKMALGPATNEAYNLSSNRETSVRELAEAICKVTDFAGELVWDTTKPGGAPRRGLDGTKAKERFGFVAETGLEEGLRQTYNWYLDNVAPGAAVSG